MSNTQNASMLLEGPNGEALVRRTPNVCGGDACIRNTRIMVWLLVAFKKQGWQDKEFLENYPSLTTQDLSAAWEYYRLNPTEIDQAIQLNETA